MYTITADNKAAIPSDSETETLFKQLQRMLSMSPSGFISLTTADFYINSYAPEYVSTPLKGMANLQRLDWVAGHAQEIVDGNPPIPHATIAGWIGSGVDAVKNFFMTKETGASKPNWFLIGGAIAVMLLLLKGRK